MRIRRNKWWAVAAAVVGAAVWLNPNLVPDIAPFPPSSARPVSVDATGDVGALLQQVSVVDHIADVEGYDRGCRRGEGCVFGPAWNDPLDSTGRDARNRMLAAQLRDVRFKPNTHNCKLIDGFLDPDPYTGQRVALEDIEMDHVYALAAAWDASAWQWDPQKRQIFANDAAELLAASGAANRQKSDKRLHEWLPAFQPCDYVQRYLAVAVKYQLPITVAERNTAAAACPAPAA